MITIVNEYKTTIAYILFKILTLLCCEFNELMTTQVAERATEYRIIRQGNYVFLEVYPQGCVLDQGIQDITWHPLINIPVTGLILDPRKKELVIHQERYIVLV